MGIKEEITADMKQAMRDKDNQTRDTLRLLLAALKQAEVDGGKDLDEAATQAIIMKQAKQRRESISEYEKANRNDLADPEKAELAVIEKYLPQMMGREEIEVLAREVIAEVGADNPKMMGAVMGKLMGKIKAAGQADGKLVNQVVRELLN
ncbi:MAG: GatB/YqeY domain-containing protein [Chloroflexota bacterium]